MFDPLIGWKLINAAMGEEPQYDRGEQSDDDSEEEDLKAVPSATGGSNGLANVFNSGRS